MATPRVLRGTGARPWFPPAAASGAALKTSHISDSVTRRCPVCVKSACRRAKRGLLVIVLGSTCRRSGTWPASAPPRRSCCPNSRRLRAPHAHVRTRVGRPRPPGRLSAASELRFSTPARITRHSRGRARGCANITFLTPSCFPPEFPARVCAQWREAHAHMRICAHAHGRADAQGRADRRRAGATAAE